MKKTVDKPSASRSFAALVAKALIRVVWLWAWLMVISGSVVLVGIACRLFAGSFHWGWSLPGRF